jgi:hypothetical protein
MQELDQLYRDNEALRTELSSYRTAVDMEILDRKL